MEQNPSAELSWNGECQTRLIPFEKTGLVFCNGLVLDGERRRTKEGNFMPQNEVAAPDDVQAVDDLHKKYLQITERMRGVIVGQEGVIEQLLIAFLCRSHCILEGVPGLAKTLMVSTLASLLNQTFRRIQFTPDLMPADITGTDILEE